MDSQHDITDQLFALRNGADPTAWDQLVPLVYDELRVMAHRQLQRERAGHTLSTTALVHEAYLKLVDQHRAQWKDRAHFFAIASEMMRRVLVDYARRHRAAKRDGARVQVSLDTAAGGVDDGRFSGDALAAADSRADTLIALDEALTRLAARDERLVRVVECRFFGGLTEEETAAALNVTARTVRRDWIKAKNWLHRELAE